MTKRINCIATPRNISTALMYSFAQRKDTHVIDEPFYAYYLCYSNRDHPGRDIVLQSQDKDPERVRAALVSYDDTDVLYIKNMAHHVRTLPRDWLDAFTNVLLIRDPHLLITSLAQVLELPTMFDVGLDTQVQIFEELTKKGHSVLVVDSEELLQHPHAILKKLCGELGIPFSSSMLRWNPRARPEDGVWAKYWYRNVHRSSGFGVQHARFRPMPGHCKDLYDQAMPYYERLYLHAIKAPN